MCGIVIFVPYRHRFTALVDGMCCVSILYVCVFKTWFAPRVDGKLDDILAGVFVFISLMPLGVGACVASYYGFMKFGGGIKEKETIQKHCEEFCSCVLKLSAADDG